jgi:succinate dehydrogenase / fumarate reductase cytochrome b subunit
MRWLINSPIGRKFIMSISGLFLVSFALFHAVMNSVFLISPKGYDIICHFLGANWYALILTKVLALGFIIHIVYALILTLQNLKARGADRYAITKRQKGVSWASKNMLILGGLILAFIVLHLVHFWSKMQLAEVQHIFNRVVDLSRAGDGSYWINWTFTKANPMGIVNCLIYLVVVVLLWLHMTHGFWSGLQSLGWSNNVWLPRIKVISVVIATIVAVLFAAIPLAYLFGFTPDLSHLHLNCC